MGSVPSPAPPQSSLSQEMATLWRSQNFAQIDLPAKAKNFVNSYLSDEKDGKGHRINYTLYPCIKDDSPETKPIIFWTMGGPSVSQILFWRNMGGPIRAGRRTLIFNKYSWTKFANLVSLDYPWGSPFSRDRSHPKVDTVKQMATKVPERFNRFVKKFFEKHSAYNQAPFFYAGDSSGILFP